MGSELFKLPSKKSGDDHGVRQTRQEFMRAVALFLDGMSRALILSFGPSLVSHLVYGGTLKLGLDCARVAFPLAVVAVSYLLGKALGTSLAVKSTFTQDKLPQTVARLSGIAIALLVFTFGAGLSSVWWLVLIRFVSGLIGGILCVITDTPYATKEKDLDEGLSPWEGQMEAGVRGTSSCLSEKHQEYVCLVSGIAKIYMTAFAVSILAGGLLYRHAAGDATFRALTGFSKFILSPLFLVAVSLCGEWVLRCTFSLFEQNHDASKKFPTDSIPAPPVPVSAVTPVKLRQRVGSSGTDAFAASRDRLGSFSSVPFESTGRDRLETSDSQSEFFDCNSVLSGMEELDWFDDVESGDGPNSFVSRYVNKQCLDGHGAPSYVPNGDSPDIVPENYLTHCGHNHKKAEEMWKTTQDWRRQNKVWRIHTIPNYWFRDIKQAYPHFIHGFSKKGYPIIYEQPGKMNLKQLFRSGCEVKDMLRHYMFLMEFISNCICTREEVRAKMGLNPPPHNSSTWGMLVVMDVKGAGVSHLSGDVLTYLKGAGDINNAHYPLNLKRAFLVNSPFWLAGAWSGVKGILPESVQVDILSSSQYLDALHEYIDDDQIPKEYGGSSPYQLGEHPFEKSLHDLVNEAADSAESSTALDTPKKRQSQDQASIGEGLEVGGIANEEEASWIPGKNNLNARRRRGDQLGESSLYPLTEKGRLGEEEDDIDDQKKPGYGTKTSSDEYDMLIMACTTHALWSCIQGMIETAIPFWILIPPELGGLGYAPSRSGVSMFSSVLVLLWIMQTKVSKVMSKIPSNTPLRSFRIGVGAQSVLLLLLGTVPRTVHPDKRSNAVLVMTMTIIFMSCIVLSSILGRTSSTILHRLAAASWAQHRKDANGRTHWFVRQYGETAFARNCESGRFTNQVKFVAEIVGVLMIAPLGWWSLHPNQRMAPFDGTLCLFLSSLVTLILYGCSFSFQLNAGGEMSITPKDGRRTWRTRDFGLMLSEMATVSLNDMASLLDETNWSLSPLLRRTNTAWEADATAKQ